VPRRVREAFDAEHRRRNGFDRPGAEVEVVAVRARIVGTPALTGDDLPEWPLHVTCAAPSDTRLTEWGSTAIHRRAHLVRGRRVDGPALVEDDDTTVAIPPGAQADVDRLVEVIGSWS